MKKEQIIILSSLLVFMAAILIIQSSIKETPIQLDSVEIREYQGQKLDSINDFRENSIKGPQYIDIENYQLEVIGLVNDPTNYSYEDILKRKSYSKVVTLDCVEGWSATILWEGIILRELLEESNPTSSVNTIIFHAEDGYTTSFPIDYIMKQDLLLAYKMNNATIVPERGFPFQLVAEDKWGYKWIKWITKIEFSDNQDYEGYWESRGYSNTANLNERF